MTQTDKAAESVPCGGCGATSDHDRCIGCGHDFGTPESEWFRDHQKDAESLRELQELRAGRDAAMNEIGMLRRENVSLLAENERLRDVIAYCLQDDLHNRLTPRVVDIAYSAFMSGACGKNKDDGGKCDWFTDTKPMVMRKIAEIACAALQRKAGE